MTQLDSGPAHRNSKMPETWQQTELNPAEISSNESIISSPGLSLDLAPTSQKGKPMSRRGHFKSRLGCFNCKRRRVKCNELRPSCSPCRRLGLNCAYPLPGASSPGLPRSALPTLTIQDLQFYHQFLTAATPTIPMRATEVWNQVTAMSHTYDFLAHAVLALGAHHLSRHGSVDFTETALHHRVTAIRLANEQLAKPSLPSAETDALFATFICLVAQSSFMQGGMMEYLTMVRGAFLILNTLIPRHAESLFRKSAVDEHMQAILLVAKDQPKDTDLIAGIRAAVKELESICQEPAQVAYWSQMINSIDSMSGPASIAWQQYTLVYLMPATLTLEDYVAFTRPDNQASLLLVIHSFLLEYVLGRLCVAPADQPKYTGRKTTVITWARDLASSLSADYRGYMAWALSFCDDLEHQDGRHLFSP